MISKDDPSFSLAQKVERLASQCVKCALCLPHCPTYELSQDENESPRGRIALLQALSQAALPLTPPVQAHLDRCLVCRACEPVCPAHVQYGELMTSGRALIKELPHTGSLSSSWRSDVLQRIVQSRFLLRGFHFLLWGLQASGLRTFAQSIGLTKLFKLEKVDKLLGKVASPQGFKTYYPAIATKKGSVSLFIGCINSICDQETIESSIFVLRKIGFDVLVPPQDCCGAIALHAGDSKQAMDLALKNVETFVGSQAAPLKIISIATGCGATLSEYNKHFSLQADSNESKFDAFSNQVNDIITFVLANWPADLSLQPVPLQGFLHTPCTRRNVLKSPGDPLTILSKIPQLVLKPFVSKHCCGAAGTYMIEHPEFSEPLINSLLSELDDIPSNFIATSNIGCALQFQKSLNSKIKVLHPIYLIAKGLGI